MIYLPAFAYKPQEYECERASGSYLMSLVALLAGLPLPIINLLATFFFFIANRRGSYFVRWHCTQALLSQFSMLLINSTAFWWTVSIIWGDGEANNAYFGYLFTALLFNITEFGATIYTAIKTREGVHVEWWLYGPLTHLLIKDKPTVIL